MLAIFYDYRKLRTLGDYFPPSYPKDLARWAIKRRMAKIEFLENCWPALREAYDRGMCDDR